MAEANKPPAKRRRTEQPIPGWTTHEASHRSQSHVVSPPITLRQVDQTSRAPPLSHAHPSKTWRQELDAEWAHIFKQMFLDLGFKAVNYSEVPPCDDEEVRSLIDALLPTREVYFARSGEPDPYQSYRAPEQGLDILRGFQRGPLSIARRSIRPAGTKA